MPKRQVDKKKLLQPDQFLDFWSRTANSMGSWAAGHKRALVISATALATVIVGSVVLSQVAQRHAATAAEDLDRVERIAAAEVAQPGATATDDGLPHLGSVAEQEQAALKELDGKLASGRGPLGPEAALVRGRLLLDLGRAPEAASTFQGLLDGKLDGRLRFLAREGLGYAYEGQGKLAEAGSTFSQLGDDAARAGLGSFYKDRAVYHQGRLAELRSNPAEAARLYHEVLDKFPSTSLRDEIQNRIAALEMK
ncbi:MAG TPA: tetratricopeptide repeat protein [Polyangia bacterium]|nr:tetratricopeptide repeat protein [Polyangia bacterium]